MVFPYDATGIVLKDYSGFEPLPENSYDFQIIDGKEKLTKNGDQMVNVTLEVVDSLEFNGRKVWHNIVFLPKEHKASGIAIHFLKTIGEPWEGKFEVDTDRWIGRRIRAKVGIESYVDKEGKTKKKNSVVFVETYPGEQPKKVSDEDVPF